MTEEKSRKFLKIFMEIVSILIIIFFAYSLTPKTFQNDTFYTIKIGEHIQNNMDGWTDFLPGKKGLDLQDPFSFHKDLPYMYPHWLYDLCTYKLYQIDGFNTVYIATCVLSVILGLSIYYINRRLNKSILISFMITVGSMYCLKNFIAARAQLLTFILFAFTILGIEKFLQTKKLRYVLLLLVIPIIIANVHSAVWPFYFVLYLPYIAEYFITCLATTNFVYKFKSLILKFKKKKIGEEQYKSKKEELKEKNEKYKSEIATRLDNTYKLKVVKESGAKWLIVIAIVCLFTGLLTPIKDMPYTYIIRTEQGETTQNISEHLPLVLINNTNMIVILVILFGLLMFTRTKIKIRDFFMLLGLLFLTFMTQRQSSMLILIGNFILVRLICEFLSYLYEKYFKKFKFDFIYIELAMATITAVLIMFTSVKYTRIKKNDNFVNVNDYPVAAADFINNEIIPKIGKENLRLYNEYNYGSYLLFKDIPVFIDSRCDLYTQEFNGTKIGNGKYFGRDIFNDAMEISRMEVDYDTKFKEYDINYIMTYSGSKLKTEISKDVRYQKLYDDGNFAIFKKIINSDLSDSNTKGAIAESIEE